MGLLIRMTGGGVWDPFFLPLTPQVLKEYGVALEEHRQIYQTLVTSEREFTKLLKANWIETLTSCSKVKNCTASIFIKPRGVIVFCCINGWETLHVFSWCFYQKRFTTSALNHVHTTQNLPDSCLYISFIKDAELLQALRLETIREREEVYPPDVVEDESAGAGCRSNVGSKGQLVIQCHTRFCAVQSRDTTEFSVVRRGHGQQMPSLKGRTVQSCRCWASGGVQT